MKYQERIYKLLTEQPQIRHLGGGAVKLPPGKPGEERALGGAARKVTPREASHIARTRETGRAAIQSARPQSTT